MHILTNKQNQILRFVEKYVQAEAQSPTYKEIQEYFGFESINAVRKYISLLSERGYLKIFRTKTGRCKGFSSLRMQSSAVPLLGTIAAGLPIEAIENCTTTIDLSGLGIDNSSADHFALTVKGNSMIEAHITDGDMVIIKKQPTVKNGEVAAVLWNGEATLKYVKSQPDGSIMLVPANKTMQPMEVTPEKVVSFQILGKLVKVIRTY
jgi:repressor LexA